MEFSGASDPLSWSPLWAKNLVLKGAGSALFVILGITARRYKPDNAADVTRMLPYLLFMPASCIN
jgi:hypothetical protein